MPSVVGPKAMLPAEPDQLLEVVPVAFLPQNYALTVAAMSYNGKLDFSLLGDYDAMSDIDEVGRYLEESLAELLAVARKPAKKKRPKATVQS